MTVVYAYASFWQQARARAVRSGGPALVFIACLWRQCRSLLRGARHISACDAARRQLNATLLPTGDVLVTGGTSGSGFNDLVRAVRTAELWNPTTGKWTGLASSTVP